MDNKRTTYSVEWMPSLLRLCLDIQIHTERLHEAKLSLEQRLNQIEADLEEVLALDRQIIQAQAEVGERQSEVDQAEAQYLTYREGIMSRMMDAARAGESIDREEAGRLVELEIGRNLGIEKLKTAALRAEELIARREKNEAAASTAYASCAEIESFCHCYDEAASHLKDISQSLKGLSPSKDFLGIQGQANELNKFVMLVDSYSTLVRAIRAGECTSAALSIQRQCLGQLPDIVTIDPTTLFGEICIALATQPLVTTLLIPDQEPFFGDLTEY